MPKSSYSKRYNFFKRVLTTITENKFAVLLGYLGKKDKIRVKLKIGLQMSIARDELLNLQVIKDAIDYGISIEIKNQTMSLSAYPILDLKIGISDFSGTEQLNVISIVLSCIQLGMEVDIQKNDEDPADNKNCILVNPINKLVITQSGVRFFLDSIIPGIFAETFFRGIHSRPSSDFRGMTIMDVGANFGDSSLFFAKNGGKVYAVEPIKSNFGALERNTSLNNRLDLQLFNLAIGPEGTLTMSTKKDVLDGGASGFYLTGGETTEIVKSIPVALFLKSNGLKNIDLLKMDCKGCEKYLTSEDLRSVNQYLHIELDPNSEIQEIERLFTLVESSGFEFKILNHNPGSGIGKGRNFGMIYAKRK